ncbi:MAG: 50S ribosomal protein L23 [Candidatus Dasytiphilus stammeri]
MMSNDVLMNILYIPHISEKSSIFIEKNNTFVIKVAKKANKWKIKYAVEKLFNVEVKKVNTLLIKEKSKKNKQYKSRYINWKKAYITLKKGHKIDLLSNSSGIE